MPARTNGSAFHIPAQHHVNTASGARRATSPLALLHTDLCGPLAIASLSGSRYILTITDDFSRYTWLYFLTNKSDTLSKFKSFKTMIELQENFKIKVIRLDRGGEYTSHSFAKFCKESGILRQFTQAHTPHQTGWLNGKIGVYWKKLVVWLLIVASRSISGLRLSQLLIT